MESSLTIDHPLTVVFASDNRGVLQLGIAVYSLLESADKETKYRIYILEDGISDENKTKLRDLQKQFDTEIRFVSVSHILEPFQDIQIGQWPPPAYARLFISTLLPEEKGVILYADIDVLFCKDLREIFETAMDGHVLGAVYEKMDPHDLALLKIRLGMPETSSYFNSGVLLINLDELRARNGGERMKDYFLANVENLRCPDQDILNAVFHAETTRLHPKWNWTDGYSRRLLFKPKSRDDWGNGTRREVLEAAHSPGILHYWGKYKPWRYNFRYEGERYRQVWLRSPWGDVPVEGKTFKIAFRKATMKPYYSLVRNRVRRLLKAELASAVQD